MKGMIRGLFIKRTVEDIIRDMNEAGVGKSVYRGNGSYQPLWVEWVTNEDVSRIAEDHPDRFIPFASVDPSRGTFAVDKLIHAVKNLKCRGLKLHPPCSILIFPIRNTTPCGKLRWSWIFLFGHIPPTNCLTRILTPVLATDAR